MSAPVAPGRAHPAPLPDKSLTTDRTPGKRVAVVDRSKVDPQMLKAAQGMEGMFLDYMMKTMRDTVPKSELSLDNTATKIYQGMMDTEMAQTAARTGGIGLADQIIAYMETQRYNYGREHAAPDQSSERPRPSTGGTHEGQSAGK